MKKLKILFVTTEIDPFFKVSDVADIVRKLPQGLQDKGHEIRILMPRFGLISEKKNRLHDVVRLSGINITVGEEEKPLTIKVASIPGARLQVYFLDNEDYFHRKAFLTNPETNTWFDDNDERCIFFCKGTLETVKKLGWAPDIIHCHNFMTSLIPLYIKTIYKDEPVFRNTKVVYSLYNNSEYNFEYGESFIEKAAAEIDPKLLQHFEKADFLGVTKGGIAYADAVTLGEPQISKELTALVNDKQTLHYIDIDQDCIETYNQFYTSLMN